MTDRTKFAQDRELRDVLVLLRMAGFTQAECAAKLNTTRQNVSIEEQEERFTERIREYAAILALQVLPKDSSYRDYFKMPSPIDERARIKKNVYV